MTEADSSVKKVQSAHSPRGPLGQTYLASGKRIAMRMWKDKEPDAATGKEKEETRREYETLGFVLQGRARLHLEGQTLILEPGDCWVVPEGASHRYEILESFSAIEATSPPAQVHGRDEGTG